MTTSANLIRHRLSTDVARQVELHEASTTEGEPTYLLIFRYDYLNGYRSISVQNKEVLRNLADQIETLLNQP